jgi:hypothetical protein
VPSKFFQVETLLASTQPDTLTVSQIITEQLPSTSHPVLFVRTDLPFGATDFLTVPEPLLWASNSRQNWRMCMFVCVRACVHARVWDVKRPPKKMFSELSVKIIYVCRQVSQIFQKSRGHPRILGFRMATRSHFHTEDPKY